MIKNFTYHAIYTLKYTAKNTTVDFSCKLSVLRVDKFQQTCQFQKKLQETCQLQTLQLKACG